MPNESATSSNIFDGVVLSFICVCVCVCTYIYIYVCIYIYIYKVFFNLVNPE